MNATFEQRIRERAYEIWMAAGQEEGLADRHWLSAEAAVLSEMHQTGGLPMKKAGRAKTLAAKTSSRSGKGSTKFAQAKTTIKASAEGKSAH